MSQPPLLRMMPFTGKPVVLLRYQHRDDGIIRASDRREIEPREVLNLLEELGVADETMDDVAYQLGMERGD